MAWVYLAAAGLLEIVWAAAMKQSAGFTRIMPTAVMAASMVGSCVLLSLSMRSLPLSIAYPMWTGIGALGAFGVGVLMLGEAANPIRIVAVVLIVSGLVLMRLSVPAEG